MKQLLPLLFIVICLTACRGSRSAYRNEEKDITTLINRLIKKGSDDKIIADLQEVYNGAYLKINQRLANYQYDPVPAKWDKLIPELEGLHRMFETISRSAYALRLVKPANVYPTLIATKDSAAFDYYNYASNQLLQQTRQANKEAYYSFERAMQYVPNYRDARDRMKEAFDRSIVHVLVNYIEYDVRGLGSFGWSQQNNSDRQYHSRIINDLGGQNSTNTPARFYDPYDLRRVNVAPQQV
ncbi:MAG: hypothetical protein KA160_06955, partial [Lacibacter sp.]|nr:hypothetical protein [Lacibacter sp.]